MAMGQITKDDRTGEIAIFARLIKTEQGDLGRELARYILTLGFDEEDQATMRELAERNQEATGLRGTRGASSLRQGRSLARSASLESQAVVEGEEGFLKH